MDTATVMDPKRMPMLQSTEPAHKGGLARVALVAGVAAVAAAVSFVGTTGSVLARRGHPLVAMLNPGDPALATLIADGGSKALAAGDKTVPPASVAASAASALLAGPLNPAAIRALGIARFAGGDERTGKNLVELASRISKRDLVTQGWLFDRYLRQAQPEQAFRALDYAIRSHDEVKPLLFPRLAQAAIQSSEARNAIAPYIDVTTPWAAEFISAALAEKGGAAMVARLARDVGGLPDTALFTNLQPEIVRHLLEAGAYQDARSYLAYYDRKSSRIINQLAFEEANVRAGQSSFAWVVGEVPGTYGEFVSVQGGKGRFAIDVGEQQAGALLTKVLVLAPGSYELAAPSAEGAPDRPWVAWTIQCVSATEEAVRLAPGTTGSFMVPPNCPAQRISLAMIRDPSSRAATYTANIAAPTITRR